MKKNCLTFLFFLFNFSFFLYGECVCVSIDENLGDNLRDARGECYDYNKYIPNESTAIEETYRNMHELNARYSLAEVRYQMGMDNVQTLFPLFDELTEDADKAEYENYMAFNGTKMSNWPEATQNQIELLRNIAANNTGRSSEMAKGLLCFFFGECMDDISKENTTRFLSKNTQRQWVYMLFLKEFIRYK